MFAAYGLLKAARADVVLELLSDHTELFKQFSAEPATAKPAQPVPEPEQSDKKDKKKEKAKK